MKEGKTPWTTQTGAVLRVYESKGLTAACNHTGSSFRPGYQRSDTLKTKHRLDFWWHSRYRRTSMGGDFTANSPGTGRHHSRAGELILHPAVASATLTSSLAKSIRWSASNTRRKHYRIDESRLVARGFSMGGRRAGSSVPTTPRIWAALPPRRPVSAKRRSSCKVFQKKT